MAITNLLPEVQGGGEHPRMGDKGRARNSIGGFSAAPLEILCSFLNSYPTDMGDGAFGRQQGWDPKEDIGDCKKREKEWS